MNVPHKITKLSPEQAYIYGFLDGKMFEENKVEEVFVPFKQDKNTVWIRSNGTKIKITEMNDYHLTASYKKKIKEGDTYSNLTRNLWEEIKARNLEDYL